MRKEMIYLDFSDGIRVAILKASLQHSDEEIRREVPTYYFLNEYANKNIQDLIDRDAEKEVLVHEPMDT